MRRSLSLLKTTLLLAALAAIVLAPTISCSSRSTESGRSEATTQPQEPVTTGSISVPQEPGGTPAYPKDRAEVTSGEQATPTSQGVRMGDTETDLLGGWLPPTGSEGATYGNAGMGGYGNTVSYERSGTVSGTEFSAWNRGGQRGVPILGDTPLVGGLFRAPRNGPPVAIDLVNVTADEIWVIAKANASRPEAVGPEYETPGSGAMLVTIDKEEVPLPLKHTDVQGQISGYIATVHVTQRFHNPYGEKIEAVYVFPLPQNAAVNEFVMIIGERKIRGIIRERQEAEQIYTEARRQGLVASLLTQERPNIFTQKVANIEPGKDIDVDIKYFNTLAYVDGWYEFVFPMVVGPRFNPPGTSDGVGAVARGQAGISGQATEVQYLAPNERSGHDIALAVDIDAGVDIEEIACPSHAIKRTSSNRQATHVEISPLDSIPNKDFVLRYKVAGDTIKSAVVTHRDERGGYFSLLLTTNILL